MNNHTNNHEYLARVAAKIPARPMTRYAVHAYQRQVWAGASGNQADQIISEYALLGQRATKHRIEMGQVK